MKRPGLTEAMGAVLSAAIRIDGRCAQDGEGPLDRFERMAALFQKETGFMAPGKDSPAAGYAGEAHERERQEAWKAWSNAPFDELRTALNNIRAASGSPEWKEVP